MNENLRRSDIGKANFSVIFSEFEVQIIILKF